VFRNDDEMISIKTVTAKTISLCLFAASIDAYSKTGNIKAYRKKKEKRVV